MRWELNGTSSVENGSELRVCSGIEWNGIEWRAGMKQTKGNKHQISIGESVVHCSDDAATPTALGWAGLASPACLHRHMSQRIARPFARGGRGGCGNVADIRIHSQDGESDSALRFSSVSMDGCAAQVFLHSKFELNFCHGPICAELARLGSAGRSGQPAVLCVSIGMSNCSLQIAMQITRSRCCTRAQSFKLILKRLPAQKSTILYAAFHRYLKLLAPYQSRPNRPEQLDTRSGPPSSPNESSAAKQRSTKREKEREIVKPNC